MKQLQNGFLYKLELTKNKTRRIYRKSYKHLILFWSLLFLLTGCGNHNNYEHVALHVKNGPTIQLKQLKGTWIVINYFAYWCKPCHYEVPELNKLAKNYPGLITVYGVDYDRGDKADKMGIQFQLLTNDPAPELGVPHINALPTTIIINPNLDEVQTLHGAQTQNNLLKLMDLHE